MRALLGLVVAAAALSACSDEPPADAGGASGGPGATAACGPVQTIPLQGEGHLVGDQEPPVAYNSTPPTSGWHTSGDVPITVFGDDEALTEPEQVTVLELGGALATYHEIAPEDRQALEELSTTEYLGKLAVTPYDALEPGTVALTAWTKLQRCESLDLGAVAAFVDAYAEAG